MAVQAAIGVLSSIYTGGQAADTAAGNVEASAAALTRATQKSRELFDIGQGAISPFADLANPALADIRAIMGQEGPSDAATAETEALTRGQSMAAAASGKLGSGEHLRRLVSGADQIADREFQRKYGRLLDINNLGRQAAGGVAELAAGTAGTVSGLETGTQTALNSLATLRTQSNIATTNAVVQGIGGALSNR